MQILKKIVGAAPYPASHPHWGPHGLRVGELGTAGPGLHVGAFVGSKWAPDGLRVGEIDKGGDGLYVGSYVGLVWVPVGLSHIFADLSKISMQLWLHMGPNWVTLLGPTWARPNSTIYILANTPMWDRDGSKMGCLCVFSVGFVARPHLMRPYGTHIDTISSPTCSPHGGLDVGPMWDPYGSISAGHVRSCPILSPYGSQLGNRAGTHMGTTRRHTHPSQHAHVGPRWVRDGLLRCVQCGFCGPAPSDAPIWDPHRSHFKPHM